MCYFRTCFNLYVAKRYVLCIHTYAHCHLTFTPLFTVYSPSQHKEWCCWDRCIAQGPLISKLCLTHLVLCGEDDKCCIYEYSVARNEASNERGRYHGRKKGSRKGLVGPVEEKEK